MLTLTRVTWPVDRGPCSFDWSIWEMMSSWDSSQEVCVCVCVCVCVSAVLYPPTLCVCVCSIIPTHSVCVCVQCYTHPLCVCVCVVLYPPTLCVCVCAVLYPPTLCVCVCVVLYPPTLCVCVYRVWQASVGGGEQPSQLQEHQRTFARTLGICWRPNTDDVSMQPLSIHLPISVCCVCTV